MQYLNEDDHWKRQPRKEGKWTTEGGSSATAEDKGAIETESIISITGNELGEYSNIEDLRDKAVTYFRDNLQGKIVKNADIGEVLFSWNRFKKYKSASANPIKLKMVVALKDIIQYGQGREIEMKKKHKEFSKLYRIDHVVEIGEKKYEASVLIGEDEYGKKFYNLMPDKSELDKDWNNKKEAGFHGFRNKSVHAKPASNESIFKNYKRINIHIEETVVIDPYATLKRGYLRY
ncbi:MAG: hypothetical protein LBT79_07965 [Elusimicrobiota bacterium]|jgi:hypothetical protein|nr:hypothetical protein [Elusimicrobiota bacterium]